MSAGMVTVQVTVNGEGESYFTVPSTRLSNNSDPVSEGLTYAAEKHAERVARDATEADYIPQEQA